MRAKTLLKLLAFTAIRTLLQESEKCRRAKKSDPEGISEYPPTRTTTDTIVRRLRSLNELHTSSLKTQTVVAVKVKNGKGILRGSAKLLYVAFGEIRAGIDLAEVTEKIDVDGIVRIRLPQVQILTTHIDVEDSFVYDVTKSILFSPETTKLQTDAQQTALKDLTDSAVESGILEAAAENAIVMVKQLLMGFTDRQFIVEFE